MHVIALILFITAIAFLYVMEKSRADASNPTKTIPFICLSCGGMTKGNGPLSNAAFYSHLTGKDLTNAYMVNLTPQGTDWIGTIFKNATLQGTFDNCIITGVDFTGAVIALDIFDNSDATNANFTSANFIGSSTSGAQLSNSNFTGANFSNAILTNNIIMTDNFTNANFTNATLKGATSDGNSTFTGAIWANTICPDGTNSNSDGNSCIGHGF